MSHILTDAEIWKPAFGLELLYEVSNLGRVKSLSRPVAHKMRDGKVLIRMRKERILKPSAATGYLVVSTAVGSLYVHHLVLEAFVCPRPQGLIGLHSDDDGTNCQLSNLRWGTYKQNAEDAKRNGIRIGAPLGNLNAAKKECLI